MPRLKLNDFELAFHDEGSGTPVVLIHGLGSSSLDWETQRRALSPFHRVISFDLRGHGESGRPPGPYQMSMFARDVAALMRHLQLPPAHVVGISLGGMIAFQLALDHALLVRDLVIINSGPAVVPTGFKQHMAVAQRRVALNVLGLGVAGRLVEGKLFPRAEQAPLREAFRARWQRNDRASYRATLEAIIGWSVRERLGELCHRTLVISGDRDYTPIAVKQEYVNLLSDAELLVIPDSGHATPADQPDALNAALLSFLNHERRHDSGVRALAAVDGQTAQPLASAASWMPTSASRS